ncbi:Outer membrane porin protein 32 [Paraburkholderia aspalathi]|uniref:Outer membrane porin protein 32 n=1 Tax=Paraburkholderia aspalathi TaxID=1324617 RepID=A0ABM8QZ27_9BURK|nr:porin [Paraburkholderia aspalathi]MBK3818256.1 porin [Paraburkholderia aspalathi]MBK3830110.1 porin [Paraburkholderia aspalathi]MBK3859930.1 porin [Paraburkholderia aspalathi]CAE6723721.1 Outer membrane porin protein 32 [Paraburkholderia aspalathi]
MKRFITLASGAVLSCVSASSAFAQSSVTLYGVLDNGFVYQSSGGDNSAIRAVPGGLFATRFGFKGSEDIGGGLHVNFQLEQAFSGQTGAATNAAEAFNRLAFVGLSGGFGEVRFGLQNSPQYDVLQAAMDPSWVKSIASPMNNFNGLIIRANNGISYYTPTFGGLNAKFMVALRDPSTGAGSGIGFYNVVVQYINGPLNVAAGYERGDEPAVGAGGSYTLAGGAAAGPGAVFSVFNAGASYAIGANRIWLAYHTENLTNTPKYMQHDVYQISDSYQVSPYALCSLMYGYVHDRTGGGNNAQELGLLFEYALSKATELYTAAGFIQNRNQAAYTLAGTAYSGLTITPGTDTRGIGVGIVHKF